MTGELQWLAFVAFYAAGVLTGIVWGMKRLDARELEQHEADMASIYQDGTTPDEAFWKTWDSREIEGQSRSRFGHAIASAVMQDRRNREMWKYNEQLQSELADCRRALEEAKRVDLDTGPQRHPEVMRRILEA